MPGNGDATWALQYIVTKAMAGRPEVVRALKMYLEGRLSPSEATSLGVSKNQLRGVWQRMRERAGVGTATTIVISFADMVAGIPNAVEHNGGYPICRLCGDALINVFPEDHLLKRHREEVRTMMRLVVAEWKKQREAVAIQR